MKSNHQVDSIQVLSTTQSKRRVLNLLAPIDQASFLGWSALGRAPLIQVIWIFEREVEATDIGHFAQRLNHTLLGRCVRRSLVPFGRHRWVRSRDSWGAPGNETPLSKKQLIAWADKATTTAINPEQGQGWKLASTSMSDGGAAIVLTASHCLVDGLAMLQAIGDAVLDIRRIDHLPSSYTGFSPGLLLEDIIVAIRSIAGIPRALKAGFRILTSEKTGADQKRAQIPILPEQRRDRSYIDVPFLCIAIPESDWKKQCRQLSASSRALQAAIAGRLAMKIGRIDQCGRVSIVMPVSTRSEDDTRANAVHSFRFNYTPLEARHNLRKLSQDIKQQFRILRGELETREAVLELTPYIPSAAVRWIESSIHGCASTVTVSSLGKLDECVRRPLKDAARSITIRLLEPLTNHDLSRVGGTMYCLSWSTGGHLYLSFRVWQPGVVETQEDLVCMMGDVAHEFALQITTALALP